MKRVKENSNDKIKAGEATGLALESDF